MVIKRDSHRGFLIAREASDSSSSFCNDCCICAQVLANILIGAVIVVFGSNRLKMPYKCFGINLAFLCNDPKDCGCVESRIKSTTSILSTPSCRSTRIWAEIHTLGIEFVNLVLKSTYPHFLGLMTLTWTVLPSSSGFDLLSVSCSLQLPPYC